jgi:TusE/DsrC/DsvC family sulfur relay protein
MPVIQVEGKHIELDAEGYLVDHEDWNENIACTLAVREGVTKTSSLTGEQIKILKFMRGYYEKFKAFLIPSAVCKNIDLQEKCVVSNFLDPIKAWKIAGLPKAKVIRTR